MKLRSLVGAVMLVNVLVSAAAHAQSGQRVISGRTAQWSMAIPAPWVGGSFYDLQAIVENTPAGKLRDIFVFLRNQSKDIEAYVMHYEDFLAFADRARIDKDMIRTAPFTAIRIYRTQFASHIVSMYKDAEFRKTLTRHMAEEERENWGQGALVSVDGDSAIELANMTAYESVIRIATPRAALYTVRVTVPRGDWVHIFDLRVTERHFSSRRGELRQMLQSLQYR